MRVNKDTLATAIIVVLISIISIVFGCFNAYVSEKEKVQMENLIDSVYNHGFNDAINANNL